MTMMGNGGKGSVPGSSKSADEEKAERAREMLELMRQEEIEKQRMTAGLCMFCGQRMRIALRLFRVKKHRGCHHLAE